MSLEAQWGQCGGDWTIEERGRLYGGRCRRGRNIGRYCWRSQRKQREEEKDLVFSFPSISESSAND